MHSETVRPIHQVVALLLSGPGPPRRDTTMERDLDRAGFTPAEREAFHAALDKPGPELTEAGQALMVRYEIARWDSAA